MSASLVALSGGRPIYDHLAYQQFLIDLFNLGRGQEYKHLREARTGIRIHATDIRNAAPEIYDGSKEAHKIVDALFDSSAIPFLFSTHRYCNGKVDGGVINNFPAMDLIEELGAPDDVMGFSFPPTNVYTFDQGAGSYTSAIVGTAVEHPVRLAVDKLNSNQVCELETKISMLDFELAIKHLNDDDKYFRYYDQAAKFFEDFFVPKPPEPSPQPINGDGKLKDLVKGVNDYYIATIMRSRFKARRKKFIYTCDTLYSGRYDIKKPKDEIMGIEEVVVEDQPLPAYGVALLVQDKLYDVDKVAVGVRNKSDPHHHVEVSRITLPPELAEAETVFANVILLFHEPLAPNRGNDENDCWEISYRCSSDEPLSYLNHPNHNEDSWTYNNTGGTADTEVDAIFHIPEALKDRIDLIDLPESERPPSAKWIEGRRMTPSEIQNVINSPPPLGYATIGWRTVEIPPDGAAGFLARLPKT